MGAYSGGEDERCNLRLYSMLCYLNDSVIMKSVGPVLFFNLILFFFIVILLCTILQQNQVTYTTYSKKVNTLYQRKKKIYI